ncbi:autotransporter domain-containing protein [Rhizobium sp. Rhizsp82]|uniref:autotransporter outer membrane beta-barrel domain-containing protein n=1 Tax=Rhizobium sp. Rhizsp82 TaxID=3243057 RepID=UPI0039B36978
MSNSTLSEGGQVIRGGRNRALTAVFLAGVSSVALFATMPPNSAMAADCVVSGNVIADQTDCTVENSGTISSPEAAVHVAPSSDGISISNLAGGEISGNWSGVMIDRSSNNTITNAAGATISGTDGVSGSAGISVTSIPGDGSEPDGTVINNAGTISGHDFGVGFGYVFDFSISNSGTIASTGADNFGSHYAGSSAGIYAYNTFDIAITNSGTVSSVAGTGIDLYRIGGGVISNSGTISGAYNGLNIDSGGWDDSTIAITNSGTISGETNSGINLADINGQSISIQNSGTISGAQNGIYAEDVQAEFSLENSGNIYAAGGIGYLYGVSLQRVDNATIVNSGKISGDYYGLFLNGDESVARVTNTGTISGYSYGIWSSNTSLDLVNSGTISGGINAFGDDLRIANSGSIMGDQALNLSGDQISMTNSGRIAGDDHGLNAGYGGDVSLMNSGTISGGDTALNSYNNTSVSLNNAGTISGGAYGITSSGDGALSIDNSGTISGGQLGIVADAPTTITNSGTISGGVNSIQFSSNGNTLNLLPGSVIKGAVDYNSTENNSTNFGSGSYSLAVDNYETALNQISLSNSRQSLIVSVDSNSNNGRLEVVDPGASSMDAAVRGYTNSVGNVIGSILNIDVGSSAGGDSGSSGTSALGYAEEKKPTGSAAAVQKLGEGTAVDRFGNLFWMRAFGGQTFDNDSDTRSSNYGVAAGVDRQFDDGRFGVLAGYGRIINRADDGSGQTAGNTGFGGVYMRNDFSGVTLDSSLVAGGIENDSRREIFGSDPARGSFAGWYVSPEIAISQKHEVAPGWTFTPAARLRYTAGFYQGYSETGSTQNISYDDRTSHTLEGILEGKLTNQTKLTNGMVANVSLSAALVDTLNLGASGLNASLSGTDFMVSAISDRNLVGGRFGLSGELQVNPQTTLYSGVTLGTYTSEVNSWSANAGVKVEF